MIIMLLVLLCQMDSLIGDSIVRVTWMPVKLYISSCSHWFGLCLGSYIYKSNCMVTLISKTAKLSLGLLTQGNKFGHKISDPTPKNTPCLIK